MSRSTPLAGRTARSLASLLALTLTPAALAAPSAAELAAKIQAMEAQLEQMRSMAARLAELEAAELARSQRLAELEAAEAERTRRQQEMEAAEEERGRRQEALTEVVREMREDIELPREPEKKSQFGMGPAASKVYGVERGFSVGGYGQAWAREFVSNKGNKVNDFDFKRFILYTGYKFSDELVLNAELEWEHAGSGGGGSVSLEFAQIDWFRRDSFNLRAGLLLAPIGFVNEIHEPTFYFGNERPEVERRIIPSTWRENGFGIFGKIGKKIEYRAYLMNSLRAGNFTSAGIRGGRQKGSSALSEDYSLALRADVQANDRFRFGGSIYTGQQGQNEDLVVGAGGLTRRASADMRLVELHAQYQHRGWRARALAAWTDLDDAGLLSIAQAQAGKGPVGSEMDGHYVEVGYDLMRALRPNSDKRLDLFWRYEDFDTHASMPAGFARDPSRHQRVRTVGMQYFPHPDVVFKLDFRNFGSDAGEPGDEVNLGFGWVF